MSGSTNKPVYFVDISKQVKTGNTVKVLLDSTAFCMVTCLANGLARFPLNLLASWSFTAT